MMMNAVNALGFLLVAAIMHLVPHLVPSLAEGSSAALASTLWLQFMGGVMGFIGGSWLLREAWLQRSRLRLPRLSLPALPLPRYALASRRAAPDRARPDTMVGRVTA